MSHKILIRKAYKYLWDELSTMQSSNELQSKRMLILGASGIGKSCFICYALGNVLQLQSQNGAVIIISNINKCVVIIKTLEDKLSIFQGLHNQINILKLNLTKNKKWWFLDGEEHGDFESALKKIVLVLGSIT